jgi:putative membrane protein
MLPAGRSLPADQNGRTMNFFFKVLISTFAVFISAHLLGGVSVEPFTTAIVVAFVLAVLNALLKPLLVVLTIPVTVMSLGLFLLVINAFIVQLAAHLVRGFEVGSFWWALLFSIILSVVTWILEIPVRPRGPGGGGGHRHPGHPRT